MSTQKGITMIKKSVTTSLTMLLTVMLLFSLIAPAMAKGNNIVAAKRTPSAPTQPQGPTDRAEMEAFMDGLLQKELEENHVAGAAVSVVKDGELFFAKGYGYSDIENKIPVDAQQTLFKIGSVTKLFTWTAVMQLVEQGKLDLDADINTYLDFHIPDTYPQPITLKDLMSHTAGFQDEHVDMVTWKQEDLAPQYEWLASHIPARVRPPGEAAAYSNYGAALAGYIVARVSGQSYSQYVEEHILNPLGMKSSTAQLLTPPDLSEYESVGYAYQDEAFKVVPPFYGQIDLFPDGVIRATAMDMARFMIAHLQDGRYSDETVGEARILKEDTARQMHSTSYVPDPRLLGNAYGFFEFSDNGQRVIGHSGEAEPMHSLLLLLPDQNLGVFVAYNTLDVGELVEQHLGFQRAFFDHYYPAPKPEPIQPPADFASRADHFVGSYRWTWSSSTTLEKYSTQLFGPPVQIKNPGDGTLFLATPYGNMQLVEVAPLFFQQVDGQFHFVFREDSQGHITYMFTDMIPQFGFEKVQWYETVGFNMQLLLGSLLLFFSMLLVAVISAIRNRHFSSTETPAVRSTRVAYLLMVVISIFNLLFVIGTFIWGQQIAFGIPLVYKVVMGLGVLSAILTVGALVYAILAWKDKYWGVLFRIYYTLVTGAAVAFIWFLNQWNLLGWRY
jgi:CubicO group peptidase (beta-lactamase class C family)